MRPCRTRSAGWKVAAKGGARIRAADLHPRRGGSRRRRRLHQPCHCLRWGRRTRQRPGPGADRGRTDRVRLHAGQRRGRRLRRPIPGWQSAAAGGLAPVRVARQLRLQPPSRGRAEPAARRLSPFAWSRPVGTVRTVRTILPKGLVGNPEATPKCKPEDFLRSGSAQYTSTGCAPETQVGVITLMLNDFSNSTFRHGDSGLFSPPPGPGIAVYNLEPPKGYPADFGFDVGDYRGPHLPDARTRARATRSSPSPRTSARCCRFARAEFTMWGVPADPAHDHLRSIPPEQGGTPEVSFGASSKAPIKPLLTLPSLLLATTASSSSKPTATRGRSSGSAPTSPVTRSRSSGCDDPRIRFNPEVDAAADLADGRRPDRPQVDLKSPQRNDTVAEAANSTSRAATSRRSPPRR